ncbi:hypothetical protein PGTUg99_034336 [Puccinia graminis f. sp. tritici]|uniref:Uncharacterized protein n=1 Tax=Puccinia graminis f. sp. tritici TaxID=56615 RepID=A0A5B0RQ14_PUCGR|nr:hypothetical protein PGTUg99_034336 [Puccinia graminis f. sp. tritici]
MSFVLNRRIYKLLSQATTYVSGVVQNVFSSLRKRFDSVWSVLGLYFFLSLQFLSNLLLSSLQCLSQTRQQLTSPMKVVLLTSGILPIAIAAVPQPQEAWRC